MNDLRANRRRFLLGAGTGGAAVIAGCLGDSDDAADETNGDDDDTSEDETEDPDDLEGRTVAVQASLDQSEQQELQQIAMQVQAEEIDQEEAEEQQGEVLQGALDRLTGDIEDNTDVTVTEEVNEPVAQLAVVKATGDPAGLIDVLELEDAQALISEADLDDIIDQIAELEEQQG